jgi:hypothetical protein
MAMTLEALPAHKGDSLVLRFGTASRPLLAVIDGGPSNTYKPALRPHLVKIKGERGLDDTTPLPIDWLVVSHIDDDHIKGVLELTKELVEAHDDSLSPEFLVRSIWHNTFDDLLKTKPEELQTAIAAQFGAASTADVAADLFPDLSLEAAKILASVPQGIQLRKDIKKLQLPLNSQYDGNLVMFRRGADSKFRIGPAGSGGIDVQVVGPLKAQLEELQKEHDRFLRSKKKKKTDAEAALAAFTDSSAPNLSSIVFEVTNGGSKILFTGDARGDFLLDGLRDSKLLKANKPYVVDVLKVPHHGSDRNMTQEFFAQVHATHYVFSGDGEHGNPERETLQMLYEARAGTAALKNKPFTVWLTYPIDDIDVAREEDWEKERQKGRKSRRWNAAKDSLRAFFDDVAGGQGTVIDSQPVRIAL